MDNSHQSVPVKKCKPEMEDIPEKVIAGAIKKGRLEAVRYLLENGLAPNKTITTRTIIPNVWTLIEFACRNRQESIARLLIEKGAPFDVKDKDGCTPLYMACYKGHDSIARLLIEKGADIDAQDNNGHTPLYIACCHGNDSIAELLIEKKANVDAQDKNGYTPLSLVCYNGHDSIATLLIEKGAYVSTSFVEKYPDLKVDRQIQFNRMHLYWIRTRFPDSFLGKDYLPRDIYRLIVRFYIRSEEIAGLFPVN